MYTNVIVPLLCSYVPVGMAIPEYIYRLSGIMTLERL